MPTTIERDRPDVLSEIAGVIANEIRAFFQEAPDGQGLPEYEVCSLSGRIALRLQSRKSLLMSDL
jgi:hypothetical protein